MATIVTGATGFISQNIIAVLKKNGEKLLLVGRDEKRLKALFPDANITNYENLDLRTKDYDVLIHLAVKKNNSPGTTDEFNEVNLHHLKNIIHQARSAGLKKVIYLSSLQASADKNSTPYLQSKFQAETFLSNLSDLKVVILRLPAVYADTFQGKLDVLNQVSAKLRPLMFNIFAAFKPAVNVQKVATAVLESLQNTKSKRMIVSDRQFGNWFYSAVKTIIDLCFCIFVIAFFWWLLILVWIAVKLSSPGPGILAQQRVGKYGQLFTCYKFRTMKDGTKNTATHEVSNSAVTMVGSILRKTKIDELPQICNLFLGNMTLVGPRPCLPSQTELIDFRQKQGVLKIKAGITGWAQIHGVDMSNPKHLAMLDSEYLDMRSLIMDLRIIFATTTGRGLGDRTEP